MITANKNKITEMKQKMTELDTKIAEMEYRCNLAVHHYDPRDKVA